MTEFVRKMKKWPQCVSNRCKDSFSRKKYFGVRLHFNNNAQSSLYSNVMNMSEYFNIFDFNYNSLSDSKIKQLVDLMKKKYVSYWNPTLQPIT